MKWLAVSDSTEVAAGAAAGDEGERAVVMRVKVTGFLLVMPEQRLSQAVTSWWVLSLVSTWSPTHRSRMAMVRPSFSCTVASAAKQLPPRVITAVVVGVITIVRVFRLVPACLVVVLCLIRAFIIIVIIIIIISITVAAVINTVVVGICLVGTTAIAAVAAVRITRLELHPRAALTRCRCCEFSTIPIFLFFLLHLLLLLLLLLLLFVLHHWFALRRLRAGLFGGTDLLAHVADGAGDADGAAHPLEHQRQQVVAHVAPQPRDAAHARALRHCRREARAEVEEVAAGSGDGREEAPGDVLLQVGKRALHRALLGSGWRRRGC